MNVAHMFGAHISGYVVCHVVCGVQFWIFNDPQTNIMTALYLFVNRPSCPQVVESALTAFSLILSRT